MGWRDQHGGIVSSVEQVKSAPGVTAQVATVLAQETYLSPYTASRNIEIVGPKVPESFNVLVKELQGLGLKVDLITSNQVIDAEEVLAVNIMDEASHQAEVTVPEAAISDVDMTEQVPGDDFMVVDIDDQLPAGIAIADDAADDTTQTPTDDVQEGDS